MPDFKIDDKVRLTQDIYEHADDYGPGGYLARKGEVLIVRKVYPGAQNFRYSISHEHITTNSFAVREDEIESPTEEPA